MDSSEEIVLVIPSLKAGGAERVMSILANFWSQEHRVHLIILSSSEDFFCINDRVVVHRLGYVPGSSWIKKLSSLVLKSFRLRRLIREIQPSFVLSFMTKYNVFVLISAIGTGARVFVSERDSVNKHHSAILRMARRLTYSLSKGVIVQTEDYRRHINSILPKVPVFVVPNPVNVPYVPPCTRKKVILAVGRLVQEKGHKFLIQAFSMTKVVGTWRLAIVGSGPLFDELVEFSKQAGVHDQVDFYGERNDVPQLLSECGMFVLSSVSEGFPNSLAEALVSGVPCISFRCQSGPEDLIDHMVNGILVNVGDVKGLAGAIDQLAADSGFLDRAGAGAPVLRHKLSVENIAERYLSFVRNPCL